MLSKELPMTTSTTTQDVEVALEDALGRIFQLDQQVAALIAATEAQKKVGLKDRVKARMPRRMNDTLQWAAISFSGLAAICDIGDVVELVQSVILFIVR
jgi:hypothetical protein